MRKGTKKGLIITGATIGGLIVVIIAAGAFLVTTQTGLKFILAHAGNKIQVASVKGSLVGPFTLKDVTLDTDSARVHVDRLSAHWSPGALLGGTLDIDRLALINVEVWRHQGTDKETSTGPPKLKPPIDVNIDALVLKHAVVHGAGGGKQPFVIKTASLSGKFTKKKLLVRHIEAHGPRFDLAGGAHVTPSGDYATQGKIRFALRVPDYAPATGRVRLDGTLKALEIAATVAPPYNTQATLNANALAEPLRMRARLEVHAMPLHKVHEPWPALALTATARAKGTPKNLTYQLHSAVVGDKVGTLDLALDGTYAKKIATIKSLLVTSPNSKMRLHAAGRADTGGKAPRLALNLDWQRLSWPLAGPPKITIPKGEAHVEGTPKNLSARFKTAIGKQGDINGTAKRHGERFAVNAHWTKLRWPGGGGRVTSPSGKLTFGGTMSHYQLKVDARMSAPKQTHGHLIVRGAGNKKSIDIGKIDLEALDGDLAGHARARWKPSMNGAVVLKGRGIDPGLLVGGWPGSLGIDLKASGARQNKALTARIDTFKIDGKLRGYPVKMNLAADYRDNVLELHKMTLDSGDSHIQARGRIGNTLDLDWKIASDDLQSLYPGAHGSLNGHGHVKGPRKQPHAIANLDGSDLRVLLKGKWYAFKTLHIDADVNLEGESQSHLQLVLAGGNVGEVNIDSVKLAGAGTLAKHHLSLVAKTNRGGLDLAANGGLANKRWHFTLEKATLSYPKLAPWRLAKPASGYVGKKVFALNKSCWISKGAKACLHARRTSDKLAAAFDLNSLGFAYFKPIMPASVGARGSLNAKGDFSRPTGGGTPVAHITARTSDVAILARKAGNENSGNAAPPPRVVTFAPSSLTLALDQNGLKLKGKLPLKEKGGLFLTADIPGGAKPLLKRSLKARLKARIPDISFVGRFKPTLGKLGGRVDGTMHITGSLASPVLRGRIALKNGRAQLPKPGLDLKNVKLVLTGQPDGGLKLDGQASSGGGKLALDGTANLTANPQRAAIRIQGEKFQALDNDLGKVLISPDLKLALNGKTMDLTGTVTVPSAHLTPKEIPQSAVGVSKDQVIIRPGQKKQSTLARRFNADIKLVLGDDVHFKGFGLKSRIAGGLEIFETGGQPTQGKGELHLVDGEYRAYGQGLVIQQGTLLFAGPVTEPGLDIRAVRHPGEDITVGVAISGTLKQPHFEIFSQPPMTQAEQLSWLVLGRPLNDTSDQQGSALSRLALGLGINQSNKVAKKLQKGLGVDTFAIRTGSTEAGSAQNVNQAALVIGKYLSPRLYVSYGIGLFQPVNTVRLEYTLSSRWKLATESSRIASGGDLIYTLETQ
jgi:translocation and assembly module TamB